MITRTTHAVNQDGPEAATRAAATCVYAGVQKRPLVPLSGYTQQGGSVTGGTVADRVTMATRGTRLQGPSAFLSGQSGTGLRFGKGAR